MFKIKEEMLALDEDNQSKYRMKVLKKKQNKQTMKTNLDLC